MTLLKLSTVEAENIIKNRKSKITVVGLGKMGLPLSLVFTHAGFKVTGLDISQNTIEMLNEGKTLLKDEPEVQDRLRDAVSNNKFNATLSVQQAVKDADFIIIIIPVLINDQGSVDIKDLLQLYQDLRDQCEEGVIFIQESTLPPGTTSGLIKSVLESKGWKSGDGFGLVFAPERTFSGRVIEDIEVRYPKIIGGDTKNAAEITKILYEQVCKKGVLNLSNTSTAEAVKTFKGAYRDANIAIANQFAILADLYNVDVLEIIEAANTEPFSHIHKPGIGVGGHCIPVYPRFLIAQGEDMGYSPTILSASREINDLMVDYAIDVITKHAKHPIEEVLILGVAFRGGVKEVRLSPALRLIPQLRSMKIRVHATDPLYSKNEIDEIFGAGTGIDWNEDLIKDHQNIIIVTDHAEFKGLEKYFNQHLIYDGRYVINLDSIGNSTILQPGRLTHLREKN